MNLAEAEGLLEQALGIRRSLGANRDAETATALNSLGETFRSQGLASEAELQFRQSIRIWEEAAGADHLETAISLNNLAGALQDQQRYREAEQAMKKSLAAFRKRLGPEHPKTLEVVRQYDIVSRLAVATAAALPSGSSAP